MLFNKVLALVPILAAATAFALPNTTPPASSCNVSDQQCCNSVQSASSPSVQSLFGLLGIALGSVTGQVGVTCSPITVIGASGTSCTAQPVCCSNNSFNGVVALGCTPINVNA